MSGRGMPGSERSSGRLGGVGMRSARLRPRIGRWRPRPWARLRQRRPAAGDHAAAGGPATPGYKIIKALEERVGGGYSPSPGVVYPTLTLLEELGHASVTDQSGRAGQALRLDEEGMKVVAETRGSGERDSRRVAQGAAARGGRRAGRRRGRWRTSPPALRLRLQGRPASDAQVRAIARRHRRGGPGGQGMFEPGEKAGAPFIILDTSVKLRSHVSHASTGSENGHCARNS